MTVDFALWFGLIAFSPHVCLALAEAALLDCGLLLTSDEHLCGIDHEHLTLVLNPFELIPPVIASPREIVRKFFRQAALFHCLKSV
jgi:hypothetical protein